MPSRCVAAGCSNTTKDGVSLHRFPSDPKYRRIWTTKVKLTRAKWSGPTEHSFLCSTHFAQTCFERGLHSQFGMAYKAMLLPDAIPMIFPLSKKAGKAPTKKRGVFKVRKTSVFVSGSYKYSWTHSSSFPSMSLLEILLLSEESVPPDSLNSPLFRTCVSRVTASFS